MRLEYIWIDGNVTPQLRSKTRFADSVEDWNFDGGSTAQGTLKDSDRCLKPVATYKDPFHDGLLVLCEVFDHKGKPHESNSRHDLRLVGVDEGTIFGFEQEFTLVEKNGTPVGLRLDPKEQGQYYCGVGSCNIIGRELMDKFIECCERAGIELAGINAEVMPAQWEFQNIPKNALKASDDLWVARYILNRISESYGVGISLDAKPHPDFNGAGCHTNFSTYKMRTRRSNLAVEKFLEVIKVDHERHLEACGEGYKERLSGDCETSTWETFSHGVGDRSCSIRIPTKAYVENGPIYLEDRRPCANMDPYKLTASILTSISKCKEI